MNDEITALLAFDTKWNEELKKKAATEGTLKAAKAQLQLDAAAAGPESTDPTALSVYDIQKLEEEVVPFSDLDKDTMQRLPHKECMFPGPLLDFGTHIPG